MRSKIVKTHKTAENTQKKMTFDGSLFFFDLKLNCFYYFCVLQ